MKLVVGIPVRNALPSFRNMLGSLKSNSELPYSLVICNDDSDRETTNFINTSNAKRIITHKRRQWFTRSSNDLLILGYLSGADFIFLLNSDIILPKRWMKGLLQYFKDPRVALVGSEYGTKKYKYQVVPYPHYVTGHCWCIRSEALRQVGILNEDLFHIESDKEWCHRAIRMDYRCISDNTVKVEHKGGKSWGYAVADLNKVNLRTLTKKRDIYILRDKILCQKYKRLYKL